MDKRTRTHNVLVILGVLAVLAIPLATLVWLTPSEQIDAPPESPSHAYVGGGVSNVAKGAGNTVGGGINNRAAKWNTTIAGGKDNRADEIGAAVSGGLNNRAKGVLSSVGGGRFNKAFGNISTVSGGAYNEAATNGAAVAGGLRNRALGLHTAVLGGNGNRAGGEGSLIGGGESNRTARSFSFIGGGIINEAAGAGSTISGGIANGALGDLATVAGGWNNVAAGEYSAVPGGESNLARGNHAFAAGRGALAEHDGAFVWADAAGGPLNSRRENELTLRASGGIRLASDAQALAGVQLAPGGTAWGYLGDPSLKENVRAPDPVGFLEKVESIPVQEWNLVTQNREIKHIGPSAREFNEALGLGEDERYINAADADGVNLAAIQALYRIVRRQQAELNALKAQVAASGTSKRGRRYSF